MDLLGGLMWFDHWFSMVDHMLLNKIFCLAMVVAALMNKSNDNIMVLISVILVPQVFDVLYLHDFLFNNSKIENYQYYLLYIPFDFLVVVLIAFRAKVFELAASIYIRSFRILAADSVLSSIRVNYQRHIDEFKIMAVYAAFCAINVLMTFEYGLRSLFSKDILYIYYMYTPIKVSLYIYAIVLMYKVGFQSPVLKGSE